MMDAEHREVRRCDECGNDHFASTSRMSRLCPECAHWLYGYQRCVHDLTDNLCWRWDCEIGPTEPPRGHTPLQAISCNLSRFTIQTMLQFSPVLQSHRQFVKSLRVVAWQCPKMKG
jgi:hypothetical protein